MQASTSKMLQLAFCRSANTRVLAEQQNASYNKSVSSLGFIIPTGTPMHRALLFLAFAHAYGHAVVTWSTGVIRSMSLLWEHHWPHGPLWLSFVLSSDAWSLCWWLCLLLCGSGSWGQIWAPTPTTVNGRINGHCGMVSRHSLSMIGHPWCREGPSQSNWLCVSPGWRQRRSSPQHNAGRYSVSLRSSYACPESDEDETTPTFLERNGNIRASSAPLGGLLNQHAPTLPHLIPSCPPIATNSQEVISMRLSTFSITYTQQSIMALPFRQRRPRPSIPTWHFHTHLTRKPIPMPSPLIPHITIILRRTATLAGDPKLATPFAFGKASNYLYSNFAIWEGPLSSVPAVLLHEKQNVKNVYH